jgi:copper transport protein
MRRLPALLFLLLLPILGFGSFAQAAGGNNVVLSTNPAEGETVSVPPTQVQMVFQNALGGQENVDKMGLSLACDGKLTGLGKPTLAADGVSVSVPLTQIPAAGRCTVSWSLPDGSTGTFSFTNAAVTTTTLAGGTPGTTGTDGTTATTVPGVDNGEVVTEPARLGGPIGLLRALAFLTLSALVGGLALIVLAWPEGVEYALTERYFRIMTIASVVIMVLLVSLSAAQANESSFVSGLNPAEWFSVADTARGRALLVRLVLTFFVAAVAWLPARVLDPATQFPSLVILFLMVATFGFDRTGGRLALIGAIVGVAHMLCVMMWTGGALLISRVVLNGPGERDLLDALRAWARVGSPLMVAIIGTGLFQVWRLDGPSILNSSHGRLIILKTLIVVLLVMVDFAVRQFIMEKLSRARVLPSRAVARLQRPATIQLALSVVILGVSSWLLTMRPPYVQPEDRTDTTEYAVTQRLTSEDGFDVTVSLNPGTVGPQEVLIELFKPARIQQFQVRFIPADPTINGLVINVPLRRPGAAKVSIDSGFGIPTVGQWRVEVSGTTTTGDLETLRANFQITDGSATPTADTVTDTTAPATTTDGGTTTVAESTTTTAG